MEALLRYALFNMSVSIIAFELFVIIGCLVAIVVIKNISKIKKDKNQAIDQKLSDLIIEGLVNRKDIIIPKDAQQFENMVNTLENFDQRIKDERWQEIKESIVRRYMLEDAKNNVNNSSWYKRQLAARTFLMDPSKANEPYLAVLLHDPKFVIRVVAGIAITKTSNKELFFEVIRQIARETPMSRFSYRDAIMQVDMQKFQWIEELLVKDKDPKVQAICLDLLSTRTTRNLFHDILPFIYGDNPECRLLAIKILKQMPGQDTQDIQQHLLDHEDWQVKVEALKDMDPLMVRKSLQKIEELLKNPNWFVRLQAALAIKQLEGEGLQILSRQNPSNEPLAYEISQYVMALPAK